MQGRSENQRELLDAESVAGHLLKAGSAFAFLAAHRQELFADEMFVDLFQTGRGRPSVPADVMAAVITLQALHGFSDSETVDAVTFDLRWKAACGLPVTAGAFHATTLTYWRRRLAASDCPNRIFEPVRVLADSAYGSGQFRAELAERGHVDLVKPIPARPVVAGGFTVDDFVVDHTDRIVTCPAGVTRTLSPTGLATFTTACRGCRLRDRCTTRALGRSLKVQPHDALLRAARQATRNPDWHNEYRQHRPMVERAIAWLTRDNRKLRYRGVARNNQWLHHRIAALNLRRLINLGLHHTGTNWAIA